MWKKKVNYNQWKKELRHHVHLTLKDCLVTFGVLAGVTGIGILFAWLGFTEANIITVYILGVLLIALFTKRYFCSVLSSLASVLLFNFFFTEPRLTLHAYEPGYPVTFVIMLTAALITGTLAIENNRNAKEKEEAASLAQKEQLRANLLRAISHDLRTPLTSISGNASNLLANYQRLDEETLVQMFTDIHEDAQWLISLVENLLSVTRIEDGRLNFHKTTELMEDVMEEALRYINRSNTRHKVSVEYQDEFLLAQMDVKLILQVIMNIVDNAMKYTPPESEIRICVRKQEKMLAVSISDQGPGIPDELKTQVFEMFFTGNNKIVDSRRSLGLGLPLCKSIIGVHGGELTLTDNKPQGCIFTFTLPLGEVNINE